MPASDTTALRAILRSRSYFAASTAGATLAVIRQQSSGSASPPRRERQGFRRGEFE
jgi:hypothetical protein